MAKGFTRDSIRVQWPPRDVESMAIVIPVSKLGKDNLCFQILHCIVSW